MPGRSWTASDYRYGMNGQEEEDELFKGANSAEYWMYDSRIGRRWNIDPVFYPWQSRYCSFNNNPIYFADPLGLEGKAPENGDIRTNEDGSQSQFANGVWVKQKQGGIDCPNDLSELEIIIPKGPSPPAASTGNGPANGQPNGKEADNKPSKYPYPVMKPFQPKVEWFTDGKWSWYTESKNPFPGRDYLRYARWEGKWDAEVSMEVGPITLKATPESERPEPNISYGPFSIGKKSGDLLLIGWDNYVEKYINIVKSSDVHSPLQIAPTATVLYTFVYDQNRVFLSGTTNLKVYHSFIFTPGGSPTGIPELIFDSTFNSKLATPGIGIPGLSIQKK
jgi:hypothetical protein